MGAETFLVTATGSTLSEAFHQAVAEARAEYGQGGYTGTLAEKDAVRPVFPPSSLSDAQALRQWAAHLLLTEDPDPAWAWIADKWSPAAAVRLDATTWLFFGWASS